ncbi:hypothetical protein [Pelagicoccus mobilis]|uniref:Uncharacterized protein n=1 Tax=Pelagicoccus mobilis TaxID=415221 RepID=A0A934S110_9BACT|nr:hypothetical protein [Pelagicoccus mobilis]MBK1879029.1 hypothetical protein [Pelagicoccus mobilis]
MKKAWTISLLIAVAFSSTAHSQLFSRKKARVITNAWASPEFVERRMASDEGPIPMSYHFFRGEFHGGYIKDKSLEQFPLQEIIETLANDMEAQNFFPARSQEEGDLLLVIHWGTTAVEEDLSEMFPDDGLGAGYEGDYNVDETSEYDTSYDSGSSSNSSLFGDGMDSIHRNAVLTGIDKALYKKGITPWDEQDLRSLLKDERYFIILVAYDWQKLLKEKQKKVHFITRFSLPSIGTNFAKAVPSLSRAAIPHIGTNLDDLDKTKTQLGWGKATVGELEVVGQIDEEELEEIRKPKQKDK